MATVKLNGTKLLPQPANDAWEEGLLGQRLNGTDEVGAYRVFRMKAPALAGQAFNWKQFENQELQSLQAYEVGGLPTGDDVVYTGGVVARKIARWESPLDRSVTGVELEVLVLIEAEVGS